jgi:murein L,D-transpeptidase YcbB/YkuD
MEKAEELSHYLATGHLKKKSNYVARLLKEKSRHTVELPKPIPIHVRYYTCDFYGNRLRYHDDIYKKDRRFEGDLVHLYPQ